MTLGRYPINSYAALFDVIAGEGAWGNGNDTKTAKDDELERAVSYRSLDPSSLYQFEQALLVSGVKTAFSEFDLSPWYRSYFEPDGRLISSLQAVKTRKDDGNRKDDFLEPDSSYLSRQLAAPSGFSYCSVSFSDYARSAIAQALLAGRIPFLIPLPQEAGSLSWPLLQGSPASSEAAKAGIHLAPGPSNGAVALPAAAAAPVCAPLVCLINRKESRRITNFAQIVAHLRKLANGKRRQQREELLPPFAVLEIDFGALPFPHQAAIASACNIMMAPHGAGLSNMLFMPRSSTIIEIFPYRARTDHFSVHSRALGHRYIYLANTDPSRHKPLQADWLKGNEEGQNFYGDTQLVLDEVTAVVGSAVRGEAAKAKHRCGGTPPRRDPR